MLKINGIFKNDLSIMPPLVERDDPMLNNKREKHKFNKNCKPKTLLITSENGNYLAIGFSFGNIEKEEIDFKNMETQNEIDVGKNTSLRMKWMPKACASLIIFNNYLYFCIDCIFNLVKHFPPGKMCS